MPGETAGREGETDVNQSGGRRLLRGARVWDGTGRPPIFRGAVLIEDGRIRGVDRGRLWGTNHSRWSRFRPLLRAAMHQLEEPVEEADSIDDTGVLRSALLMVATFSDAGGSLKSFELEVGAPQGLPDELAK
ncbi:MAG: hypothetical protein EBY11_15625, partial [Proteobacteria bacterium]|nr:hypothetical protein [Pseudomonadota bacterium]